MHNVSKFNAISIENKKNSTDRISICRAALILAALVFWALPALTAPEEVLRPSQLNSNPELYDGHEVVVRGYSFLAPEQNFLLDSRMIGVRNRLNWANGETGPSDNDKYCLTIINSNLLFKKANGSWGLTHHTLTLRGKFIAHYLDRGVIDFGACPIASGFIVEKIISAKK